MHTRLKVSLIACLLSTTAAMPAIAAPPEALGLAMEGYPYPHPVQYRQFTAGHETVRMAYMDVPPAGPANGRTVLLLHGKNFFGAYWQGTIAALRAAGYRVVVPDQLGFGKSSKPELAYSFHQMATETRDLLDQLNVRQVAVVGHSMGGMLAARFARLFPERTTHLVLENPIGLEDYRFKVPYRPTEALVEGNLRATEAALRQYQQGYYVKWKPEYEAYVQVQYRWTLSGEYPRLARSAALTEQMIYQQPVVHEFPLIQAPTLLAIGAEDRTVVGRNRVDAQTLKTLGQYPALARAAARAIPNARLELWPGVGHIPHFEAPERFHAALLGFLGAPAGRTTAPTAM
jgi:pimeloyl-ACP methyl ester carboxylesterase